MGTKQSSLTPQELAEVKRNNAIDKELESCKPAFTEKFKLLLLGTGSAGKSTLFKQAISLYKEEMSRAERLEFLPYIYQNIIYSMQQLIDYADDFDITIGEEESKRFIMKSTFKDMPDLQIAEHIKKLWNDPGIQEIYSYRTKFTFVDNVVFFFQDIYRISDPNYIPTFKDVLLARKQTKGIHEQNYIVNNMDFSLIDVGGQRGERKKWLPCFSGVTALLYVVAVDEYDQYLEEDPTVNRMQESLVLFNNIVSSNYFSDKNIVIFFNKSDLLKLKIDSVPLNILFPRYNGKGYQSGIEFLKALYLSKIEDKSKIYTHVTCATDTDNIRLVFDTIMSIIINDGLTMGGFM